MSNMYFWLGADGESFEVTEEEFNYRQEEIKKQKKDWLNVKVPDADHED